MKNFAARFSSTRGRGKKMSNFKVSTFDTDPRLTDQKLIARAQFNLNLDEYLLEVEFFAANLSSSTDCKVSQSAYPRALFLPLGLFLLQEALSKLWIHSRSSSLELVDMTFWKQAMSLLTDPVLLSVCPDVMKISILSDMEDEVGGAADFILADLPNIELLDRDAINLLHSHPGGELLNILGSLRLINWLQTLLEQVNVKHLRLLLKNDSSDTLEHWQRADQDKDRENESAVGVDLGILRVVVEYDGADEDWDGVEHVGDGVKHHWG